MQNEKIIRLDNLYKMSNILSLKVFLLLHFITLQVDSFMAAAYFIIIFDASINMLCYPPQIEKEDFLCL